MSKKQKVSWYDWKIIIISGMIGGIITAIIDWAKEKPIFFTLLSTLKWVWNNIFAYKMPIWLVLMALILILITIYLIPENKKEKPDWQNYTSDKIDGITWTWEWSFDYYSKKWYIKNLYPACLMCGTKILTSEDLTYGTCPRCNAPFRSSKGGHHITAIINDNIDRGLYKK